MFKIIELLVYAVMCGLLAAFIVLFLGKTGLRGKVIERSRIRLLSEMFGCDFCLCFWTSVAIMAAVSLLTGNIVLIFVAALSAPIARRLL